jgi:hypothetical protein
VFWTIAGVQLELRVSSTLFARRLAVLQDGAVVFERDAPSGRGAFSLTVSERPVELRWLFGGDGPRAYTLLDGGVAIASWGEPQAVAALVAGKRAPKPKGDAAFAMILGLAIGVVLIGFASSLLSGGSWKDPMWPGLWEPKFVVALHEAGAGCSSVDSPCVRVECVLVNEGAATGERNVILSAQIEGRRRSAGQRVRLKGAEDRRIAHDFHDADLGGVFGSDCRVDEGVLAPLRRLGR